MQCRATTQLLRRFSTERRFGPWKTGAHLATGALLAFTGKFQLLLAVPMMSLPMHYFLSMGGVDYAMQRFNLNNRRSMLGLDH